MITITIDKQYKLPSEWKDITLRQAEAIFRVPVPDKLMAYWKAKIKNEPFVDLTNKDLIKTFPRYYGDILTLLGIPKKVIDKVQPIDRSTFFNTFILEFVLGLHFSPNYTFRDLEYIEYGEKLYKPKSKKIMNVEIPMAYATYFEFTESADLQVYSESLAGGKYEVLANIASVLYRPLNEPYDEDTSLDRAERLRDMTMDDAWEVFFCFLELLTMQAEADQTHLKEVLTRRLKLPLKVRAWVRGTELLSRWGKTRKGLKT
jgi:hypothetical protein